MYRCSRCKKIFNKPSENVSYQDATPYGGAPEHGFMQRIVEDCCPHCNSTEFTEVSATWDFCKLQDNHPEWFDDLGYCIFDLEDIENYFYKAYGYAIEVDPDYEPGNYLEVKNILMEEE